MRQTPLDSVFKKDTGKDRLLFGICLIGVALAGWGAGALWQKYYEEEKPKQTVKEEPAVYSQEPSTFGNYEVFIRRNYGKTLVTCYALIKNKTDKAIFHSCTFTTKGETL